MKLSKKQTILLEWIAAIAFIILNLVFNKTSSRNVGIAFILFIAVVATVDTLKKEEPADGSSGSHINTLILKKKYGKHYLVKTFWSLALLLVSLALRIIFPENLVFSQFMIVAVVIFIIHGFYLLSIIFSFRFFGRRF